MAKSKKIKVGSDFSGVGAFNQALIRLGIDYEELFACDMDKYARQTFELNYGTPKDFPTDVYERFIPEESLDIYMTSPPCFTGDTLVNTEKGFKEIKNIKIGDLVLTHTNSYKRVIDFGSKKSKICVLNAQGIVETKTTSNHRYYVIKRYRKWNNARRCDERHFTEPSWVQASELTKDHFISINIPQLNQNPYEINKETAYVLGRYVADGWYRDRTDEEGKTKGNHVVLAIGKHKRSSISEKVKLKHTLREEINGVSKLVIYSNKLVKLIIDLNLGKGAINKRIPQDIINLPVDILKEFVQGYMDGDGHSDKNFFRATSVSKELLMGLQLCIAKIYKTNSNIKFVKTPDATVIEGRTVNQRDYYVLEFRKEMKKQSVAIVKGDKIWYPIRSIEITEEEEVVFDITVEGDHSFTANQAIVHNCQAFSLAGKRLGKDDKRGILFFNSLEFIQKNKPRYFIFENVKGLLSDNSGKTFNEWTILLGGKTINGNMTIFPPEDAVPYHLYWQVLNAKDYNIPQNRERVFLVGIRDDEDNNFSFPLKIPLEKRLKDVLEDEVDEKYFLSEKMVEGLIKSTEKHEEKGTGFKWETRDVDSYATCLRANAALCKTDNTIKVGHINQNTQASQVFSEEGVSPNICAGTHGYANGYVETKIGAIRGRNPDNPSDTTTGCPTKQRLEINESGTSNALTTVQKDNVVITSKEPWIADYRADEGLRIRKDNISPCMTSSMRDGEWKANRGTRNPPIIGRQQRIRRLTPLECFRLMDFNEDMIEKTISSGEISDSQLYKQAGNSICVGVLAAIINKLNIK